MLAFDLWLVLGLVSLFVLAVTAVLLLLIAFAVHAGLAALWRWLRQRVRPSTGGPRPRP